MAFFTYENSGNFMIYLECNFKGIFMAAIDFLMVHFRTIFEGLFSENRSDTAPDGFMGSNYCKICILSLEFYERKCTATSRKKKNSFRAHFLHF
jgi:hypothetical protein